MRKQFSFICANCGASFESHYKDAKFCSRTCSSQCAHSQRYRKDREMTSKVIQCPYNEGVSCYADHCWKCGWNPAVAQRRLNKLLGKECTA